MPARDVVDRAMADGDAPGHGDLHRCRLLLHAAGLVDQAILHEAVARVVVAFRARRPVDRLFALPLVVLEQGVAHCAGIADERDAVGTGAVDVTAPYRDPSVVVVDEDGVAARLVDDRILDAAVLRAVEDDRAAAIRGPVAAQQRLAVLHERAGGVAKSQTLERDEADRPPRRLGIRRDGGGGPLRCVPARDRSPSADRGRESATWRRGTTPRGHRAPRRCSRPCDTGGACPCGGCSASRPHRSRGRSGPCR